jgi:hypothetical protein
MCFVKQALEFKETYFDNCCFLATFGTRERPNKAKRTGCPFRKTRKRARYELLKWGVFTGAKVSTSFKQITIVTHTKSKERR